MWPINKQKCLSAPKLVPLLNSDSGTGSERWDALKRLGLRTNIDSCRNASVLFLLFVYFFSCRIPSDTQIQRVFGERF